MRSLTTVSSANYVRATIRLNIQATDVSTIWEFDHSDIVNISGLSWELPFGGGVGRPSTYRVTLTSSLGFIKENIRLFPKAEATLRVDANQDTFYPHVGRIRQVQRDGTDPNILTLTVYDRLLDSNPVFPVDTLTDSYTTLHPDVIAENIGYPAYYGKHIRPFYHTPVDCSLGSLLGPRNVSSENHVNSCFFNSDLTKRVDLTDHNIMLMPKTWAQESGSTNLVSGGYDFEVHDLSVTETRLWEYTESFDKGFVVGEKRYLPTSDMNLLKLDHGYLQAECEVNSDTVNSQHKVSAVVKNPNQFDILFTTNINFSAVFSNNTNVDTHTFKVSVSSGDGTITYEVGGNQETSLSDQVDVRSTDARHLFTNRNQRNIFEHVLTGDHSGGASTLTTSVEICGMLKSHVYRNYSIFSPQVNCGDIAISENPFAILDDVFNQASVPFVAEQSSDAQVDVSSYKFQCFFSQRTLLNRIMDDFGRITGTYLWVGDSGMINYRTYQESADVTVDATITTSDIILNSFQLKENPLGSTVYETEKAKRVKVEYDYDFTPRKYFSSLSADPTNSSLCDSAQAAGIDSEIIKSSPYIMDTDTASYYLGNIVRKATQDEEFLEMRLPAKYLGLEVSDVVKIQHPMIVGSEGLYQVTALTPNYTDGTVMIRTAKLLTLSA